MVVEGGRVRSRLLSAREAARLMGLPDSYVLPASHHATPCMVAGDGVAVPVVRWLARERAGAASSLKGERAASGRGWPSGELRGATRSLPARLGAVHSPSEGRTRDRGGSLQFQPVRS